MRNKLTLLLAAAMMAFTFQTAMAEDIDDEMDDVEIAIDEDGTIGPLGRRFGGPRDDDRGPGRHMMRHDRDGWRGGPGFGPAMRPGPRMGRGMDCGMDCGMMGRGMGNKMGHGMMNPRLMDALNLTDAQKSQAVDVLTENFRQRLLARMELGDAQKKLRDLYDAESPSPDDIIAANTAVGAAKGKLDVQRRKFRDDIRKIMTPEQIQKLDDMQKAPPPRRGGDRPGDGKRPPHGKPGPEMKR